MVDVTVSHLSKRYRITGGASSSKGWAARVVAALHRRQHDFWALHDVSFEVSRGETFGIIGRNGAGKSTLLKILSRITAPSEGEVRILGRLVALIELGSGFHPELTGRENVYLNGAILGMRRREVTAKLEQIVEFAGVREFIDVPVKWYSSGMYVRLGFSIAAHLDMDILLVDEVLAVGDAAFQVRCFARIAELKREGATILMISHDLAAVERLCARALLLEAGRARRIGPAREVVAAYQRTVEGMPLELGATAEAGQAAEIHEVVLLDDQDRVSPRATTGRPLRVRIPYMALRQLRRPRFDLFFYSFEDGVLQSQCPGPADSAEDMIGPGAGRAEFEIPALGLQPGIYTLGVTITEEGDARACAWIYGRATLYVGDGPGVSGRLFMPSVFRHVPPAARSSAAAASRAGQG
ncbi:MAG TPA: ABC transporter ATP-binding protein [Vicinamibacterales bacterium]|nr:ABC transporter ATP-binding protein [Vicinamibacterales bacterium]